MKFKVMTAIFALALTAGAAGLTLSMGSPVASAASGGNVDVTFTKWITDTDFPVFPWDMVGVVGGDVGTGTFAGEALSLDTIANGGINEIHAHYHINGGSHHLTADLHVTLNNQTGRAVINGVVTDGWLAGAQVHGEFAMLATCPIPTPGNVLGTLCFQGTLRIMAGSAD